MTQTPTWDLVRLCCKGYRIWLSTWQIIFIPIKPKWMAAFSWKRPLPPEWESLQKNLHGFAVTLPSEKINRHTIKSKCIHNITHTPSEVMSNFFPSLSVILHSFIDVFITTIWGEQAETNSLNLVCMTASSSFGWVLIWVTATPCALCHSFLPNTSIVTWYKGHSYQLLIGQTMCWSSLSPKLVNRKVHLCGGYFDVLHYISKYYKLE